MIKALWYTECLINAGFTEQQANTALKIGLEIMDDKFATKQDIQLSELALRSDMKEMDVSIRKELGSRITALEHTVDKLPDRLTIRLSSVMVVLMSAMLMIQKFLF